MRGYKAVLFAPDGDYVTDFNGRSIEEVQNMLADKGSRWFFYPFEAIILDKGGFGISRQRIIDAPEPLLELKGKSVRSASRFICDNSEMLAELYM